MNSELKIVETPRDGFQGLSNFIPTDVKALYINHLLKAGYYAVEVGSFVSPKAVPQMADTEQVLDRLDLSGNPSRVMVLAASTRSAEKAASFEQVDEILFPFSFSPTFLKRNLKSDVEKAKATIRDIRQICLEKGKDFIVYLSMAFGNPYGDHWSVDLVRDWVGWLVSEGITTIPLSDIMGDVEQETITTVCNSVRMEYPGTEFGIHLHCRPDDYYGKVHAAWMAGIRRFDVVLGGFGGCPFASDGMVSNLNTRSLITYLKRNGVDPGLDLDRLDRAEKVLYM